MIYINPCNYCNNLDLAQKSLKKRRTRIDFKPFLKISHIVCCQKNKAILDLIAKIVLKTFFYKSKQVICLKYIIKYKDILNWNKLRNYYRKKHII